jgi:hypothetical protein
MEGSLGLGGPPFMWVPVTSHPEGCATNSSAFSCVGRVRLRTRQNMLKGKLAGLRTNLPYLKSKMGSRSAQRLRRSLLRMTEGKGQPALRLSERRTMRGSAPDLIVSSVIITSATSEREGISNMTPSMAFSRIERNARAPVRRS